MSGKIYTTLAIFLAMVAISCSPVQEEKTLDKKKPNIIFLFADDQCYATINKLGNKEIITPTLDKMVEQGTTFTHAYNMGAWGGAVCTASRHMLITGKTVWRAHEMSKLFRSGEGDISKTWPKLMEKAGYNTYMSGKWHVNAKADNLFMKTAHIRPGMPKDFKEGYNRPLHEHDTTWLPWDKKWGGFWEGGQHWSEVLRDDAVSFIKDATTKEEPFFMYLAFNAAHDPRQAPKEYVDMYPLENISVPESFMAEYPEKDSIGCGKGLRDERLAPFPRTEHAIKVNRQEYYAIISHLDTQLDAILKELEASGKMDNTYIFYTADHGLACGEHGLLGKQNMYDHSVRVPFMVIGPDIPKNKQIDHDVYLQDIMATSLELAGIEKPNYVEFNSILPLVSEEKKESFYPSIYGSYIGWQRMIRKDGFKLVLYPRANKLKLFDLEADPNEISDLASLPIHKDRIKEMFEQLLDLQTLYNDKLDLSHLTP